MAKIGRNDACTCGSGKKYKKCCLDSPEARIAELEQQRDTLRQERTRLRAERDFYKDAIRLDELSNSVVDLIDDNRFDDALAICQKLKRDYPEVIDWLERSAMVHEARGDWALAADFYRQALTFTEQPDQRDSFDQELRDDFRRKLAELEPRSRTPPDAEQMLAPPP